MGGGSEDVTAVRPLELVLLDMLLDLPCASAPPAPLLAAVAVRASAAWIACLRSLLLPPEVVEFLRAAWACCRPLTVWLAVCR